MPEQDYEMRSVGVRYICDECKEGVMLLANETMLLTNPPQYPHRCDGCGHYQNFTKTYPCIEHRAPL